MKNWMSWRRGQRETRDFGAEYFVVIPLFRYYRRGYYINTDEFQTRWWIFGVRLHLVRYIHLGFDVGMRWGWA